MRVLVIGQGGREHALARSLLLSPSVTEVHAIPGHAGLQKQALCHNVSWRNFAAVIELCLRSEIDLVIVGPEEPLSLGLADALRERGILTVGPSQLGAQLEASKIFAKNFMNEFRIPTAASTVVENVDQLMSAAMDMPAPYVVKADGLAAGKGVFITSDLSELRQIGRDLFERRTLGEAGARALLEKFTPGWEVSYIIMTNGKEHSVLPIAQDHKRLLDGDLGPNTGGMGTVAPMQLSSELLKQIENRIVEPTLRGLTQRGILYRGFLFMGIMVTEQGPSLLEYNCRLGDPETQVILPLIDGDFAILMKQLAQGYVSPIRCKNLAAACIVMTTAGYPDQRLPDVPIDGDVFFETSESYFIHAGTRFESSTQKWHTSGGRVIGAVGLGQQALEALNRAYAQSTKISWQGLHKRTDIGKFLKS